MNTLMIERVLDGPNTVLRLNGRIQAGHIPELKAEITMQTGTTALDLEQVRLLSSEVITFLDACEKEGIELRNCPTYIREWITKERSRT